MPLHPHASPEGAIDTLAAPYGNNIPLFKGDGAFGTLLNPTAYGASRYTSVATSSFTNDVVFRDIEIVPMTENYDSTLEEPVHFLPLVPIALLNPSEGIAVGFATNILPRSLEDIIAAQIAHLTGAKYTTTLNPTFAPINAVSHNKEETERGWAYYFNGELTRKDSSTIFITKLPYGQTHDKVITKIDDLMTKDIVMDFTDMSKDKINVEVKFKRGYLKDKTDEELLKMLGLNVRHIENLNVLDFTGQVVWNTTSFEMVERFTEWRLQWYITRYERLRDLLKVELQRYYDVQIAIENNVGGIARKVASRSELKDLLEELGIVSLDYIADLPVYRFTEEEYLKNKERIIAGEKQMREYEEMLNSETKRTDLYVLELQDVLSKYKKGLYTK
jgi:DNA gyrase/topoisomerase IV subunit A